MSAKTYGNLLFLFWVLCQGIIGTLSKKDIDESSDLLDRQKRVINTWPGADVKEPMKKFPYVVAIKLLRYHEFCVGVILTNHIVLTVAKCVELDVGHYRVYSGCAQVSRVAHPTIHNVTNKRINIGSHMHRANDGIALITVNPPFTYSINTDYIGFYDGLIRPGEHGTVSGWGCNAEAEEHPGTAHPTWLRSINVPIISTYDCAIAYRNTLPIAENDICTFDGNGYQYCGVNDVGAPLVFTVGHVNKLVGLHLWCGAIVDRRKPDVFINLQYPTYRSWIIENINSLEEHL